MKRNSAAVFLMELIIVILFFSLSIVVTLRLFMTAYTTDKKSSELNEALIQAQSTAEQFRVYGLDMFTQQESWINSQPDTSGTYLYTRSDGGETGLVYKVFVRIEKGFESGEIQVYSLRTPDEGVLCELEIARYDSVNNEVAP